MWVRSRDQNVAIIQTSPKPRPSKLLLEKAFSTFARIGYDAHMSTTHYPIMRLFLMEAGYKGFIGDRVVDAGSGTGELTKYLLEEPLFEKIFDVKTRRKNGPVEVFCVDDSEAMMRVAKAKIFSLFSPEGFSRIPAASPHLICDISENSYVAEVTLSYIRNRRSRDKVELLRVKLITRSMTELEDIIHDELPDGADTVLLSYCMHWLRVGEGNNLNEKLQAVNAIVNSLRRGGTLISVEEFPLVVGIRKDERDVPALLELAELVDACTSPVTSIQASVIFMKAELYGRHYIEKDIDQNHRMFCRALQKE